MCFTLIPETSSKVSNQQGQRRPRQQRNLQGGRGKFAQIAALPSHLPQNDHLLIINIVKRNA